ncbi:hypothetical protein GCM10023187_30690 [Nibrella viscosa]|uniref:Uncharacterized protein n=1 Tax=Nibrella viscosa TaxID=1084524 RepID=A0ABP8KKH6_9BACT
MKHNLTELYLKNAKYITYVFLILLFTLNLFAPASMDANDKQLVILILVGLAIVNAIIYNLIPKQLAPEEIKRRYKRMVWVMLIIAIATLVVLATDTFYFRPRVKALIERASQK